MMLRKPLQASYLLLALIALLLVPGYLIRFFLRNGFDIPGMFGGFVANDAAIIIAVDLLIASIVYHIWVIAEARRLKMRNWWIYLAWYWVFAFASSFPLFLFMRERALERAKNQQPGV